MDSFLYQALRDREFSSSLLFLQVSLLFLRFSKVSVYDASLSGWPLLYLFFALYLVIYFFAAGVYSVLECYFLWYSDLLLIGFSFAIGYCAVFFYLLLFPFFVPKGGMYCAKGIVMGVRWYMASNMGFALCFVSSLCLICLGLKGYRIQDLGVCVCSCLLRVRYGKI